jgi:phosphotransferase system IIA component
VHLGINTNRLEGAGFEVHAAEGDEVEVGTAMVSWDPSDITGEDVSAVVPVLVMDAKDATVTATEAGSVVAGDQLFVLHR